MEEKFGHQGESVNTMRVKIITKKNLFAVR
jgi:hypothetical protein